MPRAEGGTAGRAARAGSAATGILWTYAALLVLARAWLALVPNMWGWGLNLQRFLAPAAAWLPWLATALALVPMLPRRATPALARAGDALARRRAMLIAMGGAAAIVWLLPDRVWFVGDFLVRAGTVRYKPDFLAVFPQSMPLDVLVHHALPRALAAHAGIATDLASRVIGALEAGAFAALAVAFTRALSLRGAPALAAGTLVLGGGTLTMFTGYPKTASELCLLTAWAGISALRLVREGRGALSLGAAVSLALGFHRWGLMLLPVWATAWLVWLRAAEARAAEARAAVRRPAVIAALALPLAALALLGPRVIGILRGFDAVHHLPAPGALGTAGLWAWAFGGHRAIDLLNDVVVLSPFALVLPVLALTVRRTTLRRRESAVLAALAAPSLAALLVIHPQQGLFRDWDVFTPAGVALSMLAAWWIAATLEATPARTWLACTVACGVAAPAAQWLMHGADLERGLARAGAFAHEAPPRASAERGRLFDYLGDRNAELRRWDAAAAALREGVVVEPSPRLLTMWALAETERGDLDAAQRAYRVLVGRAPADTAGWAGLASVAFQRGDTAEAGRARRELVRIRARAAYDGRPPRHP